MKSFLSAVLPFHQQSLKKLSSVIHGNSSGRNSVEESTGLRREVQRFQTVGLLDVHYPNWQYGSK